MASRCYQSLSSRMRCSQPRSRGGFHPPSPRYPCPSRVDPAPSAPASPITPHVLIPGVRAMPEATFTNHRNATRTPVPMQSGSRSLSRCNRGRYSLPDTLIMWHYEKTVLPKRTHSQVLLQSRFPGPHPTRLSNPAGWVSTAARHLHHLLFLSSCLGAFVVISFFDSSRTRSRPRR